MGSGCGDLKMSKARQLGAVGSQLANKNMIINGDMRIAQRGTSFPAITSTYSLDRWGYGANSDAVVTISQGVNAPTGSPQNLCPFTKYFELDVTTADTSLAATQYAHILYHMEGYDAEPLALGSSQAQSFTISFWHAHTKIGTHAIAIRNNDATRSYVAEYTQSSADTWEYSEITIPGCRNGTWLTGSNRALSVLFTPGTGSTYAGTPGSWLSGNYIGSTGQVNNLDSTSNFFRFTGVKMEVGKQATPFVLRPIGEELALCQRYYQKSYEYGTAPGTATTIGAWNLAADRAALVQYISEPFLVIMRTTPTFAVYGTTGTSNEITGVDSASLTFSSFAASARGIQNIAATGAFTATDRYRVHWTADAEF